MSIHSEQLEAVRLLMPRSEAVRHVTWLIDQAEGLRSQRIRSAADLDRARQLRVQWTHKTLEVLRPIFEDPAVAERCMAWVGKILPEFSELGAFVEQFYEQMDHHIRQLKGLVKALGRTQSVGAGEEVAAGGDAAASGDEARAKGGTVESAGEPGGSGGTIALENISGPDAASIDGAAIAGRGSLSGEVDAENNAAEVGLLVRHGRDDGDDAIGRFIEALGLGLVRVAVADESEAIAGVDQHPEARFALIVAQSPGAGEADERLSFELGYCVGRLGMARVCVLDPAASEGGLDRHGVMHVPLDERGGWQLQVARQLRRAGLAVDLNRLCG